MGLADTRDRASSAPSRGAVLCVAALLAGMGLAVWYPMYGIPLMVLAAIGAAWATALASAQQKPETPSVRELVAWATDHPATDLSVPALARRVGKSPRHLTRVFRKELGVAPAEAVEQLRLEAARRALQQSSGGLEEIAARCGFGSAEVMRRTFLRALHVTPSAYRARFSAGGGKLAAS